MDFIRSKVPDAEVVLHPYPGEAGAIGAALCAVAWSRSGTASSFRGFDTIEALRYSSTTAAETVCKWCPVNCPRTFIDAKLDRKSTRLNSSHLVISYAVFCLKKNKNTMLKST